MYIYLYNYIIIIIFDDTRVDEHDRDTTRGRSTGGNSSPNDESENK